MNLRTMPGPVPVAADAGYSGWIRSAMADAAPGAAILFDSTISEPVGLLADVVRRAFDGGVTDRYESVWVSGNRFVAAAVARRCGVEPEQVIAATGATTAMWQAFRALAGPGDHVIVEQPYFDLQLALAQETGASVSLLPRKAPGFEVDVAALEALLRPNTRVLALTQQHNPSGAVIDDATLRSLGALARRRGFHILVDEVYADFIAPGWSAARLGPEFIAVGSLTKAQGLFALKCGWIVAAPEVIARIRAANPHGDFGVSKLTHAMAALVLEDLTPFDVHRDAVLAAARPIVERHVEAMRAGGLIDGELPALGCMYFPRVVGVGDTQALSDWLWAEHRVLVAPGELFGQAGHIRLGFGGGVDGLSQGLERLHAALLEHRALTAAPTPSARAEAR